MRDMTKVELRCLISEEYDQKLQKFLLGLAKIRGVRKVSKTQAVLEGLKLLEDSLPKI